MQAQEIRTDKTGKKEEVECERCKKALGTGDCPRCVGMRLAKKDRYYLAM